MKTTDYARILRRSWSWLVIGVVLGTALGWLVTSRITPQYEATSAAVVSIDRGGTLNDLTQGNAFTERRVATYARLATQPIVTQPVIDDFELGITPRQLEQRIQVTVPIETSMLEITVQDASPALASSLANALLASLRETVDDIETPTIVGTAPGSPETFTTPVKITQVRFADEPTRPVSPNTPLIVLIGFIVGLALSALAAILRDLLDTRVRSVDELEPILSAPIVGVVPERPKDRSPALSQGDPDNTYEEAFRMLRTNLQPNEGEGPSSFLITSPQAADGKSTIVANLAVSIAATGARVLVIDAHLRRPQVAQNFDVDGTVGLADVLAGRAEFDQVVQSWAGSWGIDVLPAGEVPPNPSELLGSQRMKNLVRTVEGGRYDVILYDAAPLLPVPDATVLSRYVQQVLLVTRLGKSKREEIRVAVAAIERVHSRLTGVIANRLATWGPLILRSSESHSNEQQTPAGPVSGARQVQDTESNV